MIGERIKTARERLSMSQAELARQMQQSRGVVFGWESGRNRPEQTSMMKLAQILGVSISYIYGETDDPRPAPLWHTDQGPSNEWEAVVEAASAKLAEAYAILNPGLPLDAEKCELLRVAFMTDAHGNKMDKPRGGKNEVA